MRTHFNKKNFCTKNSQKCSINATYFTKCSKSKHVNTFVHPITENKLFRTNYFGLSFILKKVVSVKKSY